MNDTGTQEDTERSSAAAARNAAPFPPSPPACRTHLRSVSAVQPSFVAMAQMVAHSDAWSSRAYRTSRTARSRTSGESFCLVSLMTPTLSTTGVSGKTGAVRGQSNLDLAVVGVRVTGAEAGPGQRPTVGDEATEHQPPLIGRERPQVLDLAASLRQRRVRLVQEG
jgi:hypothetical protein